MLVTRGAQLFQHFKKYSRQTVSISYKSSLQGWTKHPDLPKGWRLKEKAAGEKGKPDQPECDKPTSRLLMAPDGNTFDK